MRKVTRISENTVHLVEAGDRLNLKKSEYHREDQEDLPVEFDITVAHTILRSRFGPRIVSVEKIGNNGEDDFYLADDWIVTVLEAGRQ